MQNTPTLDPDLNGEPPAKGPPTTAKETWAPTLKALERGLTGECTHATSLNKRNRLPNTSKLTCLDSR